MQNPKILRKNTKMEITIRDRKIRYNQSEVTLLKPAIKEIDTQPPSLSMCPRKNISLIKLSGLQETNTGKKLNENQRLR